LNSVKLTLLLFFQEIDAFIQKQEPGTTEITELAENLKNLKVRKHPISLFTQFSIHKGILQPERHAYGELKGNK
jgi:hypothetical protein